MGCSLLTYLLQCVAVAYMLQLQRVALSCTGKLRGVGGLLGCSLPTYLLQCVAVCYNVLQCVAVRCSELQCVAVSYSLLQNAPFPPEYCGLRVAVYYSCSVLQCVAA